MLLLATDLSCRLRMGVQQYCTQRGIIAYVNLTLYSYAMSAVLFADFTCKSWRCKLVQAIGTILVGASVRVPMPLHQRVAKCLMRTSRDNTGLSMLACCPDRRQCFLSRPMG